MKKLILSAAIILVALTGCGMSQGVLGGSGSGSTSNAASLLGGILSNATSGNNLQNILTSIIGLDKCTQRDLIGSWNYKGPGCAFMSESALAKAGGEVAASQVKEKLQSVYSSVGIKSSNTNFTFTQDGKFTAKLFGTPLSGTYTFNEADQTLQMKMLLVNITGYVKKNSDGIAILFESQKIMTLLQTVGGASGNSTLTIISNLSKNYSGVRIGMDFIK